MSEDAIKQADALREKADTVLAGYRAFLDHPAYQHNVDLAVLSKLAADTTVPVRERRRAAEMLLRFRLDAMAAIGNLTAAREQAMDALGLKANPQAMALTQVNQQIQIVRASDWRNAAPLEEGAAGEVELLAEGSSAKPDGEQEREAVEVRNAEDPAS